jgi:hypothetical protein
MIGPGSACRWRLIVDLECGRKVVAPCQPAATGPTRECQPALMTSLVLLSAVVAVWSPGSSWWVLCGGEGGVDGVDGLLGDVVEQVAVDLGGRRECRVPHGL